MLVSRKVIQHVLTRTYIGVICYLPLPYRFTPSLSFCQVVSPLIQFTTLLTWDQYFSCNSFEFNGHTQVCSFNFQCTIFVIAYYMFNLTVDDLCTVSRPAITLLTVFKDSKNPKFRISILSCLEKAGICRCVSPDVLVTTLLARYKLSLPVYIGDYMYFCLTCTSVSILVRTGI